MHHAPQGPHHGIGPQPVAILLEAVTVVADDPEDDEGHHDAAEHARESGLVALQAPVGNAIAVAATKNYKIHDEVHYERLMSVERSFRG